jgi:hypothetical protein
MGIAPPLLGKVLVVTGLAVAALGLALMFSDRLPLLGRLPGDIHIRKDNFELYVPLGTGIVVSVLVSLVVWLVSYFSKK